MDYRSKSVVHRAFVAGVVVKGIDALLEIAGGIFLLLVPPVNLSRWIIQFTQHELAAEPNDFLFSTLADWAIHFSAASQTFAALYLLSHGIVRLLLAISLLQGRLWAYPVMIILLFVFIIYQLHRYLYSHEMWLIFVSAFDLFMILLTWSEYTTARKKPFQG